MRKRIITAIGIGSILLMTILAPVAANAEVNVTVNVPLPPLVIPAPPGLVVIPDTYVYYPPDVDVDIFFYHEIITVHGALSPPRGYLVLCTVFPPVFVTARCTNMYLMDK